MRSFAVLALGELAYLMVRVICAAILIGPPAAAVLLAWIFIG